MNQPRESSRNHADASSRSATASPHARVRFLKPLLRRCLVAALPAAGRLARWCGLRLGLEGLDRETLARLYLRGNGLEIGALHHPLPLPPGARARYVDRLPVEELRRHYPELAHEELVSVDIVDNGETLATIPDSSQDFVIANGFLEHCENPLGALQNMARVLRPGGVLFLAVPDKRYTFDRDRPVTPLEHLVADYEGRPPRSRRDVFEEWTRCVYKIEDETARRRRTDELEAMNYSIHHHVWTETEILELVIAAQRFLRLDVHVQVISRLGYELDLVLRKGPPPAGST